MKMLIIKASLFVFLSSLILARPIYAYLDPGSTSFLYQVIVAGSLGALFYAKTVVRWVKNLFKKDSSKRFSGEEDETN